MGGSHSELGSERPDLVSMQGFLKKQSVNVKAWRDRYFVLNNRMLTIFDDKAAMSRAPKASIVLDDCSVVITDSETCYEFRLSTPETDARRTAQDRQFVFSLRAASAKSLASWVEALRIASRPVWVANGAVDECEKCGEGFMLGMGKHHCRNCGRIFCQNCSPDTKALRVKGYFDKVRVCRKCFPDQYAEAAKKSDLMFEASAGQRRREFERRKAAERKANRDTRREEIRLKYARASDH